jgi:glycerol-3-phosphate dehydrogenase (NAD(P)+)
MWEFDPDLAEILNKKRQNKDFLSGVVLPDSIEVTSDLEPAVTDKDQILIVLPSHVVRTVAQRLKRINLKDSILVSCSKGIENETLKRMSEVIEETLPSLGPENIVVLSGPSHAEEVGVGIPTVVVAASTQSGASLKVQEAFMCPSFRVYTNEDVTGVELGGALKNVIAIAAGISDGVGFGDNTKAALLNRGIVEITRLGTTMGADPITFAGLSGMGDLIVTCTSRHSRNRYVGEQIGKGKTLLEVLDSMVQVAEGVRTTKSAYHLSQKLKVEMPITEEVYRVLFEEKQPRDAVYDLMTREPKAEDWG